MKTKNNRRVRPRGFTLLEMTATTAMLAMLASSSMVLVRTSYTAWNRHEADHAQRQSGLAVLRHITRQTRRARAVVAISAASDNSGTLSILDSNGQVLVWDHDGASQEVRFGVDTATNLLATGITKLTFIGMKLDGQQQTTNPGLIHSIQCTTEVVLTRPSGTEAVTSSGRAWLRAW